MRIEGTRQGLLERLDSLGLHTTHPHLVIGGGTHSGHIGDGWRGT
jgi:hypothetical protein